MIVDSLPHADRYFAVHPLFEAGFRYLCRFTPDIPDGRYELEGDRLFALVQSYSTVPAAEKRFEAHRCYLDIQYLVAGTEIIGHAALETLSTNEAFNLGKDIGFFDEPALSTPVLLRAGDFAILYPNDGHKPGCAAGDPAPVRKIVLKVAL